MATEKAETDRVPITLALSTITYLEKLVRQGTHGTSVPGVARTLIEEGIRLAIKDGLLSIRDNGMTTARAQSHRTTSSGINMPAKEPTWTEERLELLKRHFAAGLTCREIAGDIGVSRNAVIGKLSRLNLTRDENPKAPRPPRKDRMRRRVTGGARCPGCNTGYCRPSMPSHERPITSRSRPCTAAPCSN